MGRIGRYLVFGGLSLSSFGCLPILPEEESASSTTTDVEINEEDLNFTTITVDGCEYLILERDRNNPHEGFGFMAHKGNCKNPIHPHNQ